MNLNCSSNELAITKVDRDDSGFYVCAARNYAGYINTTFFVNVQYPPYVLISEQKVSIVAGAHAILRCPVNANPAAEIQWITPVWFQGPRLTITKVNISHDGQYSCRGKNFLGTTVASLQVQVMTPPHIVDLKLVHLLNNIVSISCVTIGTPESVVDWIDLTPSPAGFFNVHDGNLQIEKKYINNMKFLCNASNVYGWMTKHVAVPSSPYNFNTTKISSSSVTFSWLTDDSEIISNFIVERRSISDWVTINSSVISPWFEDRNLSPFTTFLYRVSAENVLGTSKLGGSFNVSTKEGVPSYPSKLEAKSRSLTSITVYWEPPTEPRGQLTNIVYEMYYKESTTLPENEVKIAVENMKGHIRIQKLKSNTLYIIKIRAGRQTDGGLNWSDYRWLRTRTLQKAPTTAPKEIKAVSNGPRKIYVTWERSHTYVEGYKLQYKEYESINLTTVVQIKSWNTSSYMIMGLTASRYYEIQLNMFTTGGDGPWSHPKVVHTEADRLALPGPIASSSGSLPWKIAVGGSVLAVILLLLLLLYIYLMRKSNHKERSDTKRTKKKSRKHGGYDFTDNMSGVSNESEGSTEGVYNVNIVNDHIDLSMFDNSHHTIVAPETMYVENPILPTHQDDSDDSDEAVRLATFIARPSPHPTPHLTGRRQLDASHVNPAYHSDEDDDMYSLNVDRAATTKRYQTDENSNNPVYAQVDLAKKERDKKNSRE
ncbi:Down syndrome cell adhesion molecule homolog [Paramuricea clavata]|uniref:Down syndrome cell adhesion molecule homolog n=1 Tax=Paramuricea clavata TaxID=317549 RepID=A0A6S7H1L5_PARCT|nr:Down syndrome cell adhesion molecule homolog [Paramuricea clavata]